MSVCHHCWHKPKAVICCQSLWQLADSLSRRRIIRPQTTQQYQQRAYLSIDNTQAYTVSAQLSSEIWAQTHWSLGHFFQKKTTKVQWYMCAPFRFIVYLMLCCLSVLFIFVVRIMESLKWYETLRWKQMKGFLPSFHHNTILLFNLFLWITVCDL